MSASFLSNFMLLAQQKTGAERALAVDSSLNVVDMINLQQSDMLAESFIGVNLLRQALENGEPIITNNAVTDPARAPVTNTNFSDLRVIVVIPIDKQGAIYLDRPLRTGMIVREVVRRLMAVAQQAVQTQQMNSTQVELGALYEQVV